MTLEEFGKSIKEKYPQYSALSDADLGKRMLEKYPQYSSLVNGATANPDTKKTADTFLAGHPVLKGISDFVGTTGLGKGLAQAIFLNFTNEGKDTLKMLEEGKITPEQFDDIVGGGIATPKEVIGSAAQTGLTVAALGKSPLTSGSTITNQGGRQFIKSAAKQVAKTGAITGGISAAKAASENKSAGQALKDGATGAMLGGGISAVGSVAKLAATKALPKLLSFTSLVPETALETQMSAPGAAKIASKEFKEIGAKGALEKTQSAVVGARKALSTQYDDGLNYLTDKFAGQRFGFSERDAGLIRNALEKYPSLNAPTDMASMGVREGVALLRDVNEALSKGANAKSPEGFLLRKVKEIVKDKLVANFGGDAGDVSAFLKNYSDKKSALDAFETIVEAFRSGNPKTKNAAISRIQQVFAENKEAFVDAVMDFEKAFGDKGILQLLATAPTQKFFAKRIGEVGLGEIIRAILFPLTSPKIVGKEVRSLGATAAGEVSNIGALTKGIGKTILGQ